ncbi:hypothetical protein GCM10010896_13810 [Mammaliicoccus stepanovicii]|nr:hypothetical protein GCM10010896_13810 [Mammaliicoccus stepanovicii]
MIQADDNLSFDNGVCNIRISEIRSWLYSIKVLNSNKSVKPWPITINDCFIFKTSFFINIY